MMREELIRALRRLAPETGSLCCLGCGYEHNCSTHGCAVIREAIEEIEAPPEPPNDPLTLDELRELDGEPVWLLGDGLNRYDIFRGERSPGWADFYCGRFLFFCYGKDWLAYRRKPEEGTA